MGGGQGGIIALVISFVMEMEGLTEVFTVIFFLHHYDGGTQANGFIHGERSTGVGSDRIGEMVLLSYYRLMFGRLVL